MRVAIFGGAGFMGRPLAKILVKSGHEVLIVDNLSVEPASLIPATKKVDQLNFITCFGTEDDNRSYFFEGDVTKIHDLRLALSFRPDLIYFFAARQGYDLDYANYAATNITSAYALFELLSTTDFVKPTRIVLASSQAVYKPSLGRSESAYEEPPSIYGMTKLQQERAFVYFCEKLGIPLVALRYSIVLGAGQSMDTSESGILRNWLRATEAGEAPQIYGDGEQIRDFVHIDDVTEANFLAGLSSKLEGRSSTILNISGPDTTIGNLACLYHTFVGGKTFEALNMDVRPGGEYSLTSDSSMAWELLRWKYTKGVVPMITDFVRCRKLSAEGAERKSIG
ncbi:MAG: NAD-dependent epimerase/dehydratase family protein [Candidatus Latescibacterota bacterium]|nr:MAG: NAD-dependent epimerase/dehydratase family protein [Candidatus Latescibacterota bacterium]